MRWSNFAQLYGREMTPLSVAVLFNVLIFLHRFSGMHKTKVHATRCKNRYFLEIAKNENLGIREALTFCEILMDCVRENANLRKHGKSSEPPGKTYLMLFVRSQKH